MRFTHHPALAISLLLVPGAVATLQHCTAEDPCWPDDISWAQLNCTLQGRLVRSLPSAAPCHIPYYDAETCVTVKANWGNAERRSQQPGAYQDLIWEDGDEPCYIDEPADVTCQQGLVPYYTAVVQSVEDVQAAVNFARDNSLRTRIKGASHDFFGIQTIHMKGIIFEDSFVPAACDVAAQRAVTVAAGESFSDLYKAADAHGVTVIGGGCFNVGAGGGWPIGGGHSFLSPHYGLGVDYILQFSVVTADGEARVVNECQDPDLFWAMRGGGGGFAVTTSVTYKTHPAIENTAFVLLSINTTGGAFTPTLSKFLEFQLTLADANFAGYSYLFPPASILGTYTLAHSDGNIASANATFEPLFQYAQEHADQVSIGTNIVFVESQSTLYDQILPQTIPGLAGVFSILGPRLLPRSAFEGDENSQELAGFLSGMGLGNILLLVGGGEVNRPAPDAMGVNPGNTSIPDRNKMRENLTQKTQELAQFAPGMGAYINEADVVRNDFISFTHFLLIIFFILHLQNEPEWQKTFWGDNYERLLEIKSKYDPTGVLTCGKCVGDDVFGS
ncbi:hypothetical protein BOTBODRAFT_66050 [Botryobasidium botryosum FD-172 SS1]|uniref:FAD-binding PCMH-type domain-containing protein n=1 Tax=Botryobasidium botryosum (strain FD-172 SS1) TaxID=930990 RepID=A0A067MIA9_BOTB1|nr:hypothetical protein BOTBODRAFT_66050 [Botryobasidium botryosum FD-172 SS1]